MPVRTRRSGCSTTRCGTRTPRWGWWPGSSRSIWARVTIPSLWWCWTSRGRRRRANPPAASNAVNVVYATLATVRGHALVGARPYLPREWADDPGRRARAAVPDHVVFKTKPALAVDILTDLHTAGILPPWATGDEVYGRDKDLREFCEQHRVGYVFGVPCSFTVTLTSRRRVRADQALKLVPPKGWNRASCGAGSKGNAA